MAINEGQIHRVGASVGASRVVPIQRCRLCGNPHLEPVLSLGEQYLTGIFPKAPDVPLTSGPLELVKCHAQDNSQACGLLQLRHSYDLDEMYGMHYGYRSSLNQSMVRHLQQKATQLLELMRPQPDDLIVDIGSNDGTLLGCYEAGKYRLLGLDPTAKKFRDFYRADIHVVEDFFSAERVQALFGDKKAKIVTSVAMFYDLEQPQDFVEQIAEILDEDGIWHFEQSYLPSMLSANAYDTVCHEHLEYYGLTQIKWLLDRAGMKIVDVETNDVNGGSFAVTAAKAESSLVVTSERVEHLLQSEARLGLHTMTPYLAFKQNVFRHRDALIEALRDLRSKNATILGYGASTKGNVILQFCGLTKHDIPAIAEVNPDKFGSFTPGTHIPIISEAEAHALKPDYFLVMPWHFKANLVQRERAYLQAGGRLIFPLPQIEIVDVSALDEPKES